MKRSHGRASLLWLPGTSADFSQDVVVRLRIPAEILLDAHEDRGEDLAACEHEALKAPRHTTVAVPERVDHRQVEMGHPGLHEALFAGSVEGSPQVPR